MRPFGVSFIYMGWDRHYGFQIYQSDPSGNYSGWKATCIGRNAAVRKDKFNYFNIETNMKNQYWKYSCYLFQTAVGILKQEFEPETTKLQDAVRLAVKVMHKTLDVTKLTADKSKPVRLLKRLFLIKAFVFFPVELATLTRENNRTVLRVWNNDEVEVLIKEVDSEEARLEAEKKEKEKGISRKPVLK